MYSYDESFFAIADRTAALAAEGLICRLITELPTKSILDVGCGRGVWLAQWLRNGATDVLGVDGPYVNLNKLHIPSSSFLARNVSRPFKLGRRFDLVQSLEVAEHLPSAAAETFIDNLVQHGSLILFSAAVPGQGGEHHVNEQPLDYWRAKFAARDYEPFDFLRPRIHDDRTIYFCYRFNTLLYAHASLVGELPAAVRASQVRRGERLTEYRPLSLRLRHRVLRCLPRAAIDRTVRLRYRLMGWSHSHHRTRTNGKQTIR